MKVLTQFELCTDEGVVVKGEYEGNEKSRKVVVLSHGFGVKRDSRGMFSQLGDLLKDEYLVVRFDFNGIKSEGKATCVFPLSVQAKMLDAVCGYVTKCFDVVEINLIAHSMGCLVLGLSQLELVFMNKILLLAPPPVTPYQKLKDYFSKRKGTVLNELGQSKIKRSDGSWTFVGQDFWLEIKSINPLKLYQKLALKFETYFVRALQDNVIIGESYNDIKSIEKLKYLEFVGNHDFDGDARQPFLNKIVEILER